MTLYIGADFRPRTMNEGSVIKQKINHHTMTAKIGGQLEACRFSA